MPGTGTNPKSVGDLQWARFAMRSRGLAVALLGLGLALYAGLVHAATITIEWAPGVGAASYDIEQSVDNGTTWTVAKSLTKLQAGCTATKCGTTYSPPTTGLVLFRMIT